ncbi:hypothetical protein RR48_08107 [Papilio machaon]|uniref:Uncharacterized protein n=1 Tax=Papilio machaon TaxID=76193 RepID=A0A194RKL4_PAPMA|nr:hypothetical protein RR48_08107 [Papilio machaon]
MIASGIVEVNLYMDPISKDDYISIGVYKVGTVSKNVVGEKTISPRSEDFKTGWETVKISLSGSGTFMGYTETSTQQNDKDWDTSILPQDSTTMTPTITDSETDASTLLVPTGSKNKIETITERNIATSLPERLNFYSISKDIKIPDEINETTTEAIVINNELTTELGSSTSIEVNDVKRTTTEYVNYVTASWDFILDHEKSTVAETEGTEYNKTVTTTPKVSSTKHTIIKNRIERDKLRVDMLKTEAITTAGPYITTQQTEANVVTYAQTFKDVDNVLTAPNTTDLETSFKDETVVTNKTPKVQKGTTLQTDLQPLTTTVIPIVENNILLKGKAADGSIVLIDSFRYIPPAYDEDLCSIYDGTIYINDFSTEFYDLTTAEQWTEQTNQESRYFNFKRPSDGIDTYTDKTNNNTTSITYPGIAMYMLDFTTEFLDATTSEQSTDIQIVTQEAPSYTTRTSDVREDTYLTDYSSQRSAQTENLDFPTTSQIISTETSTQQNDKDWDTSILPQDSTTMTPTTTESEIDASTLLVPTDSKNKIETITERNIATSLPERLNFYSISKDIKIPDEINETTTEAIVINNELTTELGSSTSIEVNDVKRTTTEYVNYVTASWDFILDHEKSTVAETEGTEYNKTVTTTPKVSSTKHTIINPIKKDPVMNSIKMQLMLQYGQFAEQLFYLKLCMQIKLRI